MKISKSILALAFGSLMAVSVSAQEKKDDKIGTVNMQKLMNEYHKSAETRDSFKVYETEIKEQRDAKVETIKAIETEGRKLQKQAEDPSVTREKKTELFQELSRKQQELDSLKADLKSWLDRKQAALNEKAKIDFGVVRKEVMEKVHQYGEAEGFDFIFDRSGLSNTGVSIISYTKDATDLTGILLELINKDAPAEEKAVEEEAPKTE